MVGQDGRAYEIAVKASSLFDAADRALQQWARLVVVSPKRIQREPKRLWCYAYITPEAATMQGIASSSV